MVDNLPRVVTTDAIQQPAQSKNKPMKDDPHCGSCRSSEKLVLVVQSVDEAALGVGNESEARLAHRDRNDGSDSRMCWCTIGENQTRVD